MNSKTHASLRLGISCLLGVAIGAGIHHLKAGYWCKVLKTQSFPFEGGTVSQSFMAESVGMPFLDPETSVLTVTTRSGIPITVYKAKRVFQEASPQLRDVKADKNQITWQDGINTYELTVMPIEKSAEQHSE